VVEDVEEVELEVDVEEVDVEEVDVEEVDVDVEVEVEVVVVVGAAQDSMLKDPVQLKVA